MVLVFGVDIPLIEVLLTLEIITLLLLIESLIVVALLIKQMSKTKKVSEAVEKLFEAILKMKKSEIEKLYKLVKKKYDNSTGVYASGIMESKCSALIASGPRRSRAGKK